MPEDKEVEIKLTPPGTEPELVTTSAELPSIVVDGIQGVLFSGEMIKLSFFEDRQDVKSGTVVRAHVARLVMSREQFANITRHMVDIQKDMSSVSAAKRERADG